MPEEVAITISREDDSPLTLPEGWMSAPFLDVIDYEGGTQPAKKEFVYQPTMGYVRLLQIRDFGEKEFPTYVKDRPSLKKATETDLLLARYGGGGADDCLGRVCTGLGGAYNVALVKLIFAQDYLSREFVSLFFRGPWFRSEISRNSRSCQMGFNRDDLKWLSFPLSPRAEQDRIVSATKPLLQQVENARDHLSRVPGILKRFRHALLAAACSGKLTEDWRDNRADYETGRELLGRIRKERRTIWDGQNSANKANYPDPQPLDVLEVPEIPESWTWTTLDQVVQEGRPIIYGIIKPGPPVSDGIPYVRVMEMDDGKLIDPTRLRCASRERAAKFSRATLAAGDVLISKDGTIGRVSVVPPELAGGNITQHLVRVAIHRFVDLWYAVAAIRSPHSQRWLVGELKGVALQGVNVRDFRRLPIPLPPVDEQREIVQRLERLFVLADNIEQRIKNATRNADKITQSILAKAFRGELVPTEAELARSEGRDYEPASVLLERIKAERTPLNARKTRRSKGTMPRTGKRSPISV